METPPPQETSPSLSVQLDFVGNTLKDKVLNSLAYKTLQRFAFEKDEERKKTHSHHGPRQGDVDTSLTVPAVGKNSSSKQWIDIGTGMDSISFLSKENNVNGKLLFDTNCMDLGWTLIDCQSDVKKINEEFGRLTEDYLKENGTSESQKFVGMLRQFFRTLVSMNADSYSEKNKLLTKEMHTICLQIQRFMASSSQSSHLKWIVPLISHPAVHLRLASFLLYVGYLEMALIYYHQALKLNTYKYSVYFHIVGLMGLGTIKYLQKDYVSSFEHFKFSIDLTIKHKKEIDHKKYDTTKNMSAFLMENTLKAMIASQWQLKSYKKSFSIWWEYTKKMENGYRIALSIKTFPLVLVFGKYYIVWIVLLLITISGSLYVAIRLFTKFWKGVRIRGHHSILESKNNHDGKGMMNPPASEIRTPEIPFPINEDEITIGRDKTYEQKPSFLPLNRFYELYEEYSKVKGEVRAKEKRNS